MSLTQIDPASALIVVDLQKGIAAMVAGSAFDTVVENSRKLADAFRGRGLPVVLVTANGGPPGRTEQPRRSLDGLPADFADPLEAMNPRHSDLRIMKRRWGAFTGTDLEKQLRERGVTQVVMTGVATSIGVESTARQAHEAGFNVTLATDAMLDLKDEAHAASIANIFPRLGETGTTDEIIALLPARN